MMAKIGRIRKPVHPPGHHPFRPPFNLNSLEARRSSMARLRVIFENGDPERVIEFDPSKAPFHHDGRPGSILDVLLGHGIHLEHACGGNCACTTCHVIVREGGRKLSEATEEEEDMLDRAPGLTPTSRLGCQAVVEDPDAEITVIVPRFTINLVSESAEE
jgi:2Fe-2S ferredoxin